MKCTTCGYEIEDHAEICENCGRPQRRRAAPRPQERVLLGILGALLGLALGCGAYLLLSWLGIFAALAGILMALLTLGGYALLGGRVSVFGGMFSALLLLVAPFFTDLLDWALVLMRQSPEYDLPAAIRQIPNLLADGSIDLTAYANNLGLLYALLLGGVVVFVIISVIVAAVRRHAAAPVGRRANRGV